MFADLTSSRLLRFSPIAVTLVLVALTSFPVFAQGDPAQKERPRRVLPAVSEPQEILKIDTDLVPLDVTVTDARGRLVRNLKKQDFRLYEDGIERPIASFNVEKIEGAPRPAAIVFALDLSGSMKPEEIKRVADAMREFSRRLSEHPAVFALMTFGMRVKTIQSFTSDRDKLERAYERLAHEPDGMSTHTYDAVDDAVRMLVRHAPLVRQHQLMKRAVVVITDGFPVGDTVSSDTVIERANAADASVYVVTMPSFTNTLASARMTPLPTPLDVSGLAEKTGGRSIYATEKDLGPLFRAIAEEVAAAYVLGFYPPEEKRHDGQFHTIRIAGPGGMTLRQSRPGYEARRK